MITVRRITSGIISHFPIRKSEWGMGLAALGMGLALRFQPDMFDIAVSFVTLAKMADESTWGIAAMFVVCTRIIALGINGSAPEHFRHSPHLRLVASVVGLLFWSQFALGVLISAIYHGGSASAIVAYGTFCFFECCNIYQSGWDRARAPH